MTNSMDDPFADDPFAGADEDFDTPQTSYLALNDERLEGRLLILDAIEVKTMKGVDGDYEVVVANVVFPDGDPIPGFVNAIPGVYQRMHINAKGVIEQIKPKVGTGRAFICRPDVIVNKRKQRVAGVRKHEVTPVDLETARPAWRAYRAGELSR